MIASPDHFAPRHFRGGGFPDAQRFGAWRFVLNRWLLEAEMQQTDEGPFRASAYLRTLPDIRFGWGSIGPTVNRRTREIVSKDNDDLFLLVNLEGTIAASRRGQDSRLAPGDAYLMPCAQTGSFQLGRGARLLCLRAKQSGIAPLLRDPYAAAGPIPQPNESLQLLVRCLRLLDDSQPLAGADLRALVTRQILDIFALALGARGDSRELAAARSLDAARRNAAAAYIETRLAWPDLSLDCVASGVGLSRRSLQRAFETEGTSFTEFVLARRLARAHAALGEAATGTRIVDIALASGFGDISYFNRAFRARYCATPSDMKGRTALAAPTV